MMGRWALNLLGGLVIILAVTALGSGPKSLEELLQSDVSVSEKLLALERVRRESGVQEIAALKMATWEALYGEAKKRVDALVTARESSAAVDFWLRYLDAIPSGGKISKVRKAPAELRAAVLGEYSRARKKFDGGDYQGAWSLIGRLKRTGLKLDSLKKFSKRVKKARSLSNSFQSVVSKLKVEGVKAELRDLGKRLDRLEKLHSKTKPTGQKREILLQLELMAKAVDREEWDTAVKALDALATLGVDTGDFLDEIEFRKQPVQIGSISREEKPVVARPRKRATSSVTTAEALASPSPVPKEVEATPGPDGSKVRVDTATMAEPRKEKSPTPRVVEGAAFFPSPPAPRWSPSPGPESGSDRRERQPELPGPPAPMQAVKMAVASDSASLSMPRPPGERLFQAEVLDRVRSLVGRETKDYVRLLRNLGAGGDIPYLELSEVAEKGWTAEIELIARLVDPDARVEVLMLPRADRQFLRLLANRVLEEAPQLTAVRFRLLAQNGSNDPMELGSVVISSEILRLTVGLEVAEFWGQLDAGSLDGAWGTPGRASSGREEGSR